MNTFQLVIWHDVPMLGSSKLYVIWILLPDIILDKIYTFFKAEDYQMKRK